jgi:hypothetical protein
MYVVSPKEIITDYFFGSESTNILYALSMIEPGLTWTLPKRFVNSFESFLYSKNRSPNAIYDFGVAHCASLS